jgi:hypothetical protein
MGTTVYLLGHGRVSQKNFTTVPPNFTMHWLCQLGDVASVSDAFLAGKYNQPESSLATGGSIQEHYLCGDPLDTSNYIDNKIFSFFQRQDPHGSQNPCVLYPRGQTNVSLTSIFAYLTYIYPNETNWDVYWTCCRGFLNTLNTHKAVWDDVNGVTRELRAEAKMPPKLTDQGHTLTKATTESVALVAKSDEGVVGKNPTMNIAKFLFTGPKSYLKPKGGNRPKEAP